MKAAPSGSPKRKKTNDSSLDPLAPFLRDFAKESDRAAVIVGATKLDQLLKHLLQRFMLSCSSSDDTLFGKQGALSDFGARIEVSQRLGLIDDELKRTLNCIRKMRNDFSHETFTVDLSSESYRDKIRGLAAPFKKLDFFPKFESVKTFSDYKSESRDFRIVLALVCVRLTTAIKNINRISEKNAVSLVPEEWSKRTDKA